MKEETIEEPQISLTDIEIPREKLDIQFCRSSGPGGQNVNKVNSKAEVRFNVYNCSWLPKEVLKKIHQNEATRINKQGDLIL